jgi:hypothetical protein
MTATIADTDVVRALADRFITFLESNEPPTGLFEPDVFADVTVPMWRLQSDSVAGLVAIRKGGHPCQGRVSRHRLDPTPRGFVLEVEERWVDGGESWYCRELFRADISPNGLVSQVSVYCTGDWDERQVARHAAEVTLIRP